MTSSLSSFVRTLVVLVVSNIAFTKALDIEFDRIQCDETLPGYVSFTDIQMTCNNGESTRCSFGHDVNVQGIVHYSNLNLYTLNNMGYASANLRLLSIEYNLFQFYPFDFCGDWASAYNYTYDGQECPDSEGFYSFEIPYTLPWDDGDVTTWLATGWQGVSNVEIHSDQSSDSALIGYCTLHWHTYVTPSEEEGWRTMPSAVTSGIVLGSFLAVLFCCCTFATCCRRRKRHVTDVGYLKESIDYEIYDEKRAMSGKKDKVLESRNS